MDDTHANVKTGPGLFYAMIYEFIGTALLSFGYENYGNLGVIYFFSYWFAYHISGAHFNPAITFAIYLREGKYDENKRQLIWYFVAQFSGALMGVLLTYLIYDNKGRKFHPGSQFFHESEPDFGTFFMMDAILAFFHVLAYFLCKYRQDIRRVHIILRALFLYYVLDILIANSGSDKGSFNPAFAMGLSMYSIGVARALAPEQEKKPAHK